MNLQKQMVFLGRYSGTQGISIYQFDSTNGTLTDCGLSDCIENCSYLHVRGSVLYAVLETSSYQGINGGAVASFLIDPVVMHLKLINIQNTLGQAPCHLTTDRGRQMLFCANYSEGSFSCFSLRKDGSINPISVQKFHEGSGADVIRQEKAHVHCVVFTPDDQYLCVVDLGLDKIIGYKITYKMENTENIELKKAFETLLPSGTGPRHLVFSKSGSYAYAVGELSNTVTVLRYQGEKGFTIVQTVSALQQSEPENQTNCAAIKLSPDGKYSYISNRGQDTISVFKVSQETGELSFVQKISCGGLVPRDISIDLSGRYLFSANTDSNNVSIFNRDQDTGRLVFDHTLENVERPACILFAE